MSATVAPTSSTPALRRWLSRNVWVWAVIASIVLWLLGCAISGQFSFKLLLVNATLAIFMALAGIAQMTVITSGDGSFDLSLPYTVTFTAFISAGIFGPSLANPLIGIVLALLVGIIAGVLNGLLVAVLKMPAMIASLSIGYIVYSATLLVENLPKTGVSEALSAFLVAQVDGAAPLLGVGIVIGVIVAIVLTLTPYGRRLHAMGQSRPAAALSGIKVNRMVVLTFAISGLLGGVVGVLLAAYNGGAFPGMGDVYLLGSVAAVVVGGVPVSGGKSSVPAAMIGALVMTLLTTDLALSKLDPGLQDVLEGVVLIAIVTASQAGRNRRRRPQSSATAFGGEASPFRSRIGAEVKSIS